jgi:hypothetical protein
MNVLIHAADGMFMTLTQAGSVWGRAAIQYADVIAIDEAAAALEVELLSAWKGEKPRILAGDPAQLPPPVLSEDVKDVNNNPVNEFYQQLGLSGLKRLDDVGWPCSEQRYQLRMAPGCFAPANDIFYGGKIKSSPQIKLSDFPLASLFEEWCLSLNSRGLAFTDENAKSTVGASPPGEVFPMMVDAQGTFCFREIGGTSKGNTQMCSLVLNYGKSFVASSKGRVTLDMIVVVVPYLQQRQMYLETIIGNKEWRGLTIATANTYQGHERDFVLFDSTSAENLDGKVSFVDDVNRLAVATTRHKSGLVVFGDSRIYSNTVVTDIDQHDSQNFESDEEEADVDEVERKNKPDKLSLQELFKWFQDGERFVEENLDTPPGYPCKQMTKEDLDKKRREYKTQQPEDDFHLFGDFTVDDQDERPLNNQ